MIRRFGKILLDNIHWPILAAIVLIAIWLRLQGWDPNQILDYDPWWFFRHAQEILDNGMVPPKWDILSYYPPGRPVDYYLGWSYTIALFYKITTAFVQVKIETFAGLLVAIISGLSAIPAYLVGKHVTNRWGGLATAFFSTITITFMSVSLAGYSDSDATDVFYTFWAVIGTLYAIKKSDKVDFTSLRTVAKSFVRFAPHLAPALIAYWLFAVNWSSSWYIYYMFVAFIPLLIVFRVIERLISREHKIGLGTIVTNVRANRGLIFTVLVIGVIGEMVSLATAGWPFNTIPPHDQLIQGLNTINTSGIAVVGFVALLGIIGSIMGLALGKLRATVIGGVAGVVFGIVLVITGITGLTLIVNQSVAELQPLNIFTQFGQIVGRVGAVPIFFAFAAFFITALKLAFRKEIHTAEYFAIIWLIVSLFLITKGIRFSLLFSLATATAAGFAVGNLIQYARANSKTVLLGAFAATFIMGGLMHFNDNYGFARSAGAGVDISDNWVNGLNWLEENADKDSLITTWWDPGHIIAGSTGLKVMADGAHCGYGCIFLNHNTRIQDMGRAFSVPSENESVQILGKYRELKPGQCEELQRRFPDKFTPELCEPVSDVYVLATGDLIGKYYWLSFFGTGAGNVFTQCGFDNGETQRLSAPTFVCGAGTPTEVSLLQQNSTVFAVMNSPAQGVRNAPIRDVVLFQNGQQLAFSSSGAAANVIDGMVWIDPSFGTMFFMNRDVRDSVFTNMYFFNGRGLPQAGIKPLENFEMVYSNPEMKIFKVDFG